MKRYIKNIYYTQMKMRKLGLMMAVLAALMVFASCSDQETYADQKKKERAAISSYIVKNGIKVIDEEQFFAQDSTTDVSKNEYVLFQSSGVYMQIIRKGCGQPIKDGETTTVLCRFSERNLLTDSLQLANTSLSTATLVDKLSVKRSSGTFTGSFIAGSSLMYSIYGKASVPSGWLVPFLYIKVGRPSTADEKIAKVKLIVPHSQGQSYAVQSVYPCLYEITYQRGR